MSPPPSKFKLKAKKPLTKRDHDLELEEIREHRHDAARNRRTDAGHYKDGRRIWKMGGTFGRSRRRGGASIRTRSSPTLEDHVGEHSRSDAAEQATITRANHMFPVSWQGIGLVG